MAQNVPIAEPDWLMCPLSGVMYREPVINVLGNTYELSMYRQAMSLRSVDPLTNQPLPCQNGAPYVPNRAMRDAVEYFLRGHPDYVPEGWPSRAPPPSAPPANKLASDFGINMWDHVRGLRLRGYWRSALEILSHCFPPWKDFLPEYSAESELSERIGNAGGLLGVVASLGLGTFGWAFGARVLRALAGGATFHLVGWDRCPEQRKLRRLLMPLIIAQLTVGRFWIGRICIAEVFWDSVRRISHTTSKVCEGELGQMGLVTKLALRKIPKAEFTQWQHIFRKFYYNESVRIVAVVAIIHFVRLGQELGSKCAARKYDELARLGHFCICAGFRSRWISIARSLWASCVASLNALPPLGFAYGLGAACVRAFVVCAWMAYKFGPSSLVW